MLRGRHVADLHKGSTCFVVLLLMWTWDCWTQTAWTYLSLHGSYGMIWLLKSNVFPDKAWEEPLPLSTAIPAFFLIGLYWTPAFVITYNHVDAPAYVLSISIFLYCFGLIAHFGSDAQKYFVLQRQPGLITDGFFSRTRNPNFLGEFVLYFAFAMLAMHWLPFCTTTLVFSVVLIPRLAVKEKSLSRYPEFKAYKERTNLILPKLWGRPPIEAHRQD